jgi:hypothetical protein
MLHPKIRTTVVALAAACSVAVATVAPAVSQAQPASNGTAATCEYAGGTYSQGQRIVVFSGAHYDNYYCGSDGQWHLVNWHPSQIAPTPPTPPHPGALTGVVTGVTGTTPTTSTTGTPPTTGITALATAVATGS